jgi:hypothetical protein
LADWNPQLLTVIFFDGSNTWAISEPKFYSFVTNWLPHTDVVILNPPPATNDVPTGIVGQCQVARNYAPNFGWALFDGQNIFGTVANMFNAGFVNPATSPHLTDSGWAFYANALDDWLNLENVDGQRDLLAVVSGNGSGLTNIPLAGLQVVPLTNNQTGVTLTGTLNGNGSGLTNLNISVAFLPTNALSKWPAAAASAGGAALVNSNGTVYLLTSTPGSTVWTATNKIAP